MPAKCTSRLVTLQGSLEALEMIVFVVLGLRAKLPIYINLDQEVTVPGGAWNHMILMLRKVD